MPDQSNLNRSSAQQAKYKVADLHPVENPANPTVATSAMAEEIAEIEELARRIKSSAMPGPLKHKTSRMVDRLRRMAKYGSYSGEFELLDRYINWCISIPWATVTNDNLDLRNAGGVLDKNHFGMNKVKAMVLEYLAVMKLRSEQGGKVIMSGKTQRGETAQSQQAQQAQRFQQSQRPQQTGTDISARMTKLTGSSQHAPIVCFVGLQGIGKTSMAKSMAEALGRKFIRVSLGALGSVIQLRGQSRAYLDAEPGQIIKALVRAGTKNPLILLDEIDKVSGETGLRADVMAALLEILDPEQNETFLDHYVDYPVDLSQIMFICTANNLGTISTALLDRLEVVRFTSYTDEEKKVIARDYLLPKVMAATGIKEGRLEFQDDVWPMIIRPLGFEAGIRQLERNLTALGRKVARKVVETREAGQSLEKLVITPQNVKEFMPEDIGTLG